MTRLHIVIPVLFLIALTSCIAAADSYSGQSPSQGIATQQAAATATPLPPFPSLTPDPTEMSQADPSPTPDATEMSQTDPSPTHTPAPTNTPTHTPAPPTNTPVPR